LSRTSPGSVRQKYSKFIEFKLYPQNEAVFSGTA
jgi:hypothetical protein